MSFILSLILLALAGLVVLVVAASASFPRSSLRDPDAPEGEWAGPARLPPSSPVLVRRRVRPAPTLATPAEPAMKVPSWT